MFVYNFSRLIMVCVMRMIVHLLLLKLYKFPCSVFRLCVNVSLLLLSFAPVYFIIFVWLLGKHVNEWKIKLNWIMTTWCTYSERWQEHMDTGIQTYTWNINIKDTAVSVTFGLIGDRKGGPEAHSLKTALYYLRRWPFHPSPINGFLRIW